MTEHGLFLVQARKKKGLTLRELSKIVGYNEGYISNIENGRQRGSVQALIKIARALQLPSHLVLEKAGIKLIGVPTRPSKPGMDLETHQFSKLKPRTKRILLEIGELIEEHLES